MVSLRVRNVRMAWDRGSLRAKKMYLRTERRWGDRRTMGHLIDVENAWCKMFPSKAVEDAGHYMCQCPNDLYVQVRKAWYKKVITRVKDMSMRLWEVWLC